MCDFRKIVGVKINGIQVPAEHQGHFYSWGDPKIEAGDLVAGLYSIGATGVGTYYYDGKYWYSDYEYNMYNPMNHCEFICDGHIWDDYIDENGCLQPDLSNVKIQKES